MAASQQTPALGAAMFGAVAAGAAAGGYESIVAASEAMTRPPTEVYRPIRDHRATYDELYLEYLRLHDLFGRTDPVMRNLKRIQHAAAGVADAAGATPGTQRSAPARA